MRRAMLLGATLGIAPAFHNSLFILQIPVLMCVALLWLYGKPLDSQVSKILGISLLISCFVALVVPIVLQISRGAAFLAGDTIVLDSIAEVTSPLRMYLDVGNASVVTRYYSWLIVLAPIIVGIFAVRLFKERDTREVFLACAVIFGLSFMLTQFRFHPFGFWALILGPLYLVDKLARKTCCSWAISGHIIGMIYSYQMFG
jgi:hypothetical protein